MFNYKLRFIKKDESKIIQKEEVFDWLEDFYNVLCGNGQVIGGYDIFINNEEIYLTVVLPMADSLSYQYNSIYVNERLNKINEIFEIDVECEGINMNTVILVHVKNLLGIIYAMKEVSVKVL